MLSATAVHRKCTRCPKTFIFPPLSMFTGACGRIVWPRPPFKVAHKGSGRQASRADNAGCLHRWPRLTQKKSPRKSKPSGGCRPDKCRPAGEATLVRTGHGGGGGGAGRGWNAARHDSRSKGRTSAGAAHSCSAANGFQMHGSVWSSIITTCRTIEGRGPAHGGGVGVLTFHCSASAR